jgi:hypothetical protein
MNKRVKKPWEIAEEELLAKENAYLEQYNWFQKLVDNHYTFPFVLLIVCVVGFDIGLLIGVLL